MTQTKEGAILASRTNRTKYGSDYYSTIGRMGGLKKVKKGFAMMDVEKVRAAGRKGGTTSKRGKAKKAA